MVFWLPVSMIHYGPTASAIVTIRRASLAANTAKNATANIWAFAAYLKILRVVMAVAVHRIRNGQAYCVTNAMLKIARLPNAEVRVSP